MPSWPAFVGADYQTLALTADQERLVNMYVERMESPGAGVKTALYPTPGVTTIGTAMSSAGRAHIYIGGREFAVEGTSFVEIDISGNITVRGSVATNSNPAMISSNGDGGGQLLITSGTNAYCYVLATNTLTQVAALNGKATQCDFLNGYSIVLDANTSTFYISALLDASSWSTGTNFAQRSAAPDPWKAVRVLGQFIWLIGELTSEVWYDTGSGSFPFGLHPSGRVPYGIAAGFSVAEADGSIIWLGASSIGQAFVLKASGFTPEVVSDFPRQELFNSYTTISDATADTINWQGHVFYLIHFPSQAITWAYDVGTNLWFEWRTWIAEQNVYSSWRPRWHAMAFGQHRLLDAETGAVYKLDATSTTDVDARPIRRLRRAPALNEELQRIWYSYLQIDVQPGLGATTGQGANPQLMLRISKDGGQTWGNERWQTIGAIGAFSTRVKWEQIGMARRLVAELSFTDPVPLRIIDAYLGDFGQPLKGGKAA